jgi:serine/threonine-protein kinase TTK/MPS1
MSAVLQSQSQSHSQSVASTAHAQRKLDVGTDDSDDDLQPPPQLSALGRSVLEQHGGPESSPKAHQRQPAKLVIQRNSPSTTPAKDTTTPAPSQRVKRLRVQGAPVRRARRTPQSEEEAHDQPQHDHPPEQDQENVPVSIVRPSAAAAAPKSEPGSIMKPEGGERIIVLRDRQDSKPAPLAPVSINTPHRPAPPPPPPKMSVLEAATKAAGASTTKKRASKQKFVVNGKVYVQVERCGKGGSAEVHRVMAENGKVFALKKVRLTGADPTAVAGYKGEIELLKKLQDKDRVVHLYDYSIDHDKNCLYVVGGTEDGVIGPIC